MTAASTELVGAMDSVSAVVEENTAAAEESAASSGEISSAMEHVASVSEENSAAAEEVSAMTEELNAQAEELNSMIVELEALFRGSSNAAPPSGKAGHEMASAKPRKLRKNALTASSAAQNAGATDVVLKEF